jgi:hypothetical protein
MNWPNVIGCDCDQPNLTDVKMFLQIIILI